MLFAHLKRILRLGRLRLRGPNGAQFEFTLAATAQNLRRLAKPTARGPPAGAPRALRERLVGRVRDVRLRDKRQSRCVQAAAPSRSGAAGTAYARAQKGPYSRLLQRTRPQAVIVPVRNTDTSMLAVPCACAPEQSADRFRFCTGALHCSSPVLVCTNGQSEFQTPSDNSAFVLFEIFAPPMRCDCWVVVACKKCNPAMNKSHAGGCRSVQDLLFLWPLFGGPMVRFISVLQGRDIDACNIAVTPLFGTVAYGIGCSAPVGGASCLHLVSSIQDVACRRANSWPRPFGFLSQYSARGSAHAWPCYARVGARERP